MAKISASAGFPLMVYDYGAKTMVRYGKGQAERISIPHIIATDLENENVVYDSKLVGGKDFIVYFLRCVFEGKKYVIVMNDLPSRIKLGRFFTVFASVVRDMQGNRDALAERIKILKEALDEKIENRDKAVADLKTCEDKMARATEARNMAISRLKSVTAENATLKDSVSNSSEIVKTLETSIKEKNQAIAKLQTSLSSAQNVSSSEFEAKIKQLVKVRNEAVVRLKEQINENVKLKTSVSSVEEAVRRLEVSVKEKEARMSALREDMEEQLQSTAIPSDYQEKMDNVIKVRNEAIARLKTLMEENKRLKTAPAGADDVIKRLQQSVKEKDEDIEQLTKNIQETNEIIKGKDGRIAKTQFYLEEMTELVKVVKKSRDKIMTLTDFITVPMYSVSSERTLVHANNALATYVKSANVAKIVGKSCYKLVFGFENPCPWCQLEKVQKSGSSTTVGVIVNDAGKRKNIELTIFPILDSTGTLIDCGEFIVDKTDTFELAQSLKKFKEQVMSFKRAKISGMNEIQDVKKAYDELSANYDLIVARNTKLSQALESLLVQDNNKEVISAKTETAEYKAALHRSKGVLTNYKKNLDELQLKYANLNKQTFFQIERLINVVKTKQKVDVKEIGDMLASIGIDFNEVSKVLGRK